MWIYDKIKTNILGIKPTQHLKTENILFSDENFHLIKEYYDPVDESIIGETKCKKNNRNETKFFIKKR